MFPHISRLIWVASANASVSKSCVNARFVTCINLRAVPAAISAPGAPNIDADMIEDEDGRCAVELDYDASDFFL